MTISSRTPEGSSNRCPLCGAVVVIEVSRPIGDATCPACGTLLGFLATGDAIRLFDLSDSELLERIATRLQSLGIAGVTVRDGMLYFDGDSLDAVELMLELEEELGPDFFEGI